MKPVNITAEQIVEQESGRRHFKYPWQRALLFIIAVTWSLFQLYAVWALHLDNIQFVAIHLAFALTLAFIAYPFKRSTVNYIPWYDWLFIILGLIATLYIVFDYNNIVAVRGGFPNTLDIIFGTLLIVLLFIGVTRSAGIALMLIASIMIVYALTGPQGLFTLQLPDILLQPGYHWNTIIQQLYLTTEGIWGAPIRVSANFVFLFVLFGALLDRAGAGKYFITLSYSLLGRFKGGPAKAAVLGSMFTGVISGSSVSNVVTTGTFTIPLMKRVGYPPEKSAAIEISSSINGQLMPPVMGAAVFIMADFLGIPYSQLIIYAIVPALLCYLGLLYTVHLEACKLGLKPLTKDELPRFWPTFISGIYFLIPILYLLYALIIKRNTPEYSVMGAIVVLVVLIIGQCLIHGIKQRQTIFKSLKQAIYTLAYGFESGARSMVTIAIATALAGIVVGIITMTGLGFGLTDIIGVLSGGNIYIVLVLSAIACIIMGLGLPTTANYIVMATLLAPVIHTLSQAAGFDIPLVAIHLFVFYFGILADDTPPVGLAAYAGAAIAKTDPIQTGIRSFCYDIRIALLPFLFIFHPELLLYNVSNAWHVLFIITTAILGLGSFISAMQGWLLHQLRVWEQIILMIGALLMLTPSYSHDLIGMSILVIVVLLQWYPDYRLRQKTT